MRGPTCSTTSSAGAVTAGALTVVVLALAGCSAGAPGTVDVVPEVAEAWRVQIDQDLARGHYGEFEREVLADYWVTDEEYARAREPIPGCMAERGFDAKLRPEGGLEFAADPAYWGELDLGDPEVEAAGDAAFEECEGNRGWIEMYYWDMRANPEAWDFWEALIRCAERHGLSEAIGMSTEEIRLALEQSDDFLPECRADPWALAQGLEPIRGAADPGETVDLEVDP